MRRSHRFGQDKDIAKTPKYQGFSGSEAEMTYSISNRMYKVFLRDYGYPWEPEKPDSARVFRNLQRGEKILKIANFPQSVEKA